MILIVTDLRRLGLLLDMLCRCARTNTVFTSILISLYCLDVLLACSGPGPIVPYVNRYQYYVQMMLVKAQRHISNMARYASTVVRYFFWKSDVLGSEGYYLSPEPRLPDNPT